MIARKITRDFRFKGKMFSKYTASLTSMIVLLNIPLISELITRKQLTLLSSAYPLNTSSTALGVNFAFLGFRY